MRNPHGTEIRADGSVRFRLWAPACESLELCLLDQAEPLRMEALDGGWHELIAPSAGPGSRYQFLLPNGMRVPDPASRYQPENVHGPSEVVDPASINDAAWLGRPWHEAVLYELHVGAFTAEGTFHAAAKRLDRLRDVGITAVELMPIGDFPGRWNWGYDGVLPYATDSTYGRPEDFRLFVEAAHARQIMVILDVVYNHFGPEGNYLHLYAPQFFTDRHTTPWGPAINFDGPESLAVREFFIQNALYWLRDFQVDGLRLDAVHAIKDDSPVHILEDLAQHVRSCFPDRHVHLILENEENQSRFLERDAGGCTTLYTAQWNDDVHHVLHTAVTGEGHGYYADYLGDTQKLGRALAEGFAFQGEVMKYRGSARGEPSRQLPPDAFIAFLQNHDQIGNRAFGERIMTLAPCEAIRAAAAVYLLLPQIPMMFMGEEWGSRSPFPFFSDFGPELAHRVAEGRRQEFAKFPEFQDPERRKHIPDPQAESTFAAAKLWSRFNEPDNREWLEWYKGILSCRKSILPLLKEVRRGGDYEAVGPGAVVVRWRAGSDDLVLAANLSGAPASGFPRAPVSPIWLEGSVSEQGFSPWTVAWWKTEPRAGEGRR
ncbi:MAG: malto-oligosyltrehalose trehalohydrolase [Bryobacterales bacterium]|nr:malto-oligosyltrehalose trehalohydrolase [Bryobacterales bacterium]MBV9396556.1 malto-oligosyltrehalose trehalohydrolase [Bryobacterales bacterium]